MEIKYAQIEPTTYCNYSCSFCTGRFLEKRMLNLIEFKKMIDLLQDVKYLELQGEGEPLLNPDFIDMVKYASKKGIKVYTISNGSLFTKIDCEKLIKSGLKTINISIESASHDKYHFYRGGDLTNVIKGIKRIIETKNNLKLSTPSIGFSTTIMKEEIDNFKYIIDLYRDLGMDGGFEIQFLNQTDNYTKYYDDYLMGQLSSNSEMKRFFELYGQEIEQINSQKKVLNYYDNLKNEELILSSNNLYGYAKGCHMCDNSVFIDCNSNISRCVMIKDPQINRFGNVFKDDMEKILNYRNELMFDLGCGVSKGYCENCVNNLKIRKSLEKLLEENPLIALKNENFLDKISDELNHNLERMIKVKGEILYRKLIRILKCNEEITIKKLMLLLTDSKDEEVNYIVISIIQELLLKNYIEKRG